MRPSDELAIGCMGVVIVGLVAVCYVAAAVAWALESGMVGR